MIVQGCKKKFLMEIRWKIGETTKKRRGIKKRCIPLRQCTVMIRYS